MTAGSWIVVNRYKERFNRGDFELEDDIDIDVVAALVRQYIYDLPGSLFTRALRPRIDTACSENKRDDYLVVEQELPPCNRATLNRLLDHFELVVEHSKGEVLPAHLGSVLGGSYRTVIPRLLQWRKADKK